MIDFAADLASIMEDGLAVDAIYTPVGGDPAVAVRVIRSSPDETAQFGQSVIMSDTTMLTVSVAMVPNPRAGDTFTIDSEVLFVQGEPSRDPRRLRWSVYATPE